MAWQSVAAGPSTPRARTKTFLELMREDEDEKLARSFASHDPVRPSVDDFDQQLQLAMALSLAEAEGSTTGDTLQEETIPTLPETDDELLARMLQEEERLHYGMNQAVLKELTPFELKIYNLAFDADSPTLSDEEDDYEDEGDEDDAECEFDYTEPLQGGKKMYDWAQREEDRPLAHETTRMPEKRVNAAHMALHHRTFLPRNAGKAHAESFVAYDASRKTKKKRRHRRDLLLLPFAEPLHYDFALVEQMAGPKYLRCYLYSTGHSRVAVRIPFSLSNKCQRGSVIVVKRSDLVKTGQFPSVVLVLSEHEFTTLPRSFPMMKLDPVEKLPHEVLALIFRELPSEQVSPGWHATIVKVYESGALPHVNSIRRPVL